jgi:hypothetical protein
VWVFWKQILLYHYPSSPDLVMSERNSWKPSSKPSWRTDSWCPFTYQALFKGMHRHLVFQRVVCSFAILHAYFQHMIYAVNALSKVKKTTSPQLKKIRSTTCWLHREKESQHVDEGAVRARRQGWVVLQVWYIRLIETMADHNWIMFFQRPVLDNFLISIELAI